jgi:protein involved in polysaccharide export with SLBB domain
MGPQQKAEGRKQKAESRKQKADGHARGRRLPAACCLLPAACCLLLAGCVHHAQQLDQALLACRGAAENPATLANPYCVACPDVLEWTVDERPELAGRQAIGPDGRVEIGPAGAVRVEGQALTEVARSLAAQARVASSSIHVQVAEYNSQQIYLFGEVTGSQRVVSYRGDETLLQLLQRAGGITPGAAPNDVYVVRTEVIDGKPPEVFHIALRSIVEGADQRTNIRLQPFDQVYIGETRQSSVRKCLPPCIQPLFEALCGLHHASGPDTASTQPDKRNVAWARSPLPGRLSLPARFDRNEPPAALPAPRVPQPSDIAVPLPPPRRLDS